MQRSVLAWFALGLALLAGCSSKSATKDNPDVAAVRLLVSSLPDRARTPAGAAEQLIDIKPDAAFCKRVSGLMFVPDSVEVEGESAQAKVRVYNAETSAEVGLVDWTAAKRDGQWKLKSAPLP